LATFFWWLRIPTFININALCLYSKQKLLKVFGIVLALDGKRKKRNLREPAPQEKISLRNGGRRW
jgi:hypothetical protein